MTDMLSIPTLDGASMPAYRAAPAGTPTAAIVVIQEIFGVNAGIRRKATRSRRRDIWRSHRTCSGGSRRGSSSTRTSSRRCSAR